MRIAVTGANGFIGRNLVRELVARGHTVVLPLRSDFTERELVKNVRKVHFDLNDLTGAIYERLGEPDVLVHLAWGGLPNYRSTHHFEHELPLSFRFLKVMLEAGVKKLLVSGTCFEYGEVSGSVGETHPTNPKNPYGYAKDSLRRQLEFLRQTIDYKLTWMRLFYLHGNGQSSSSLLPLLDAAISRGDKVFPLTMGEQLRDYLSVIEAAEIIAKLSDNGREDGIVNVCSGEPISVRRMVENRIRETNSTIAVSLGAIPYSDLEPLAFWGDRSKLNKILST